MSFNSSINEIENLREQFQNWKLNNPRKHFPRDLWNLAFQLVDKEGLEIVSEAIGYFPSYVRRRYAAKFPKTIQEIKFVEIQPTQVLYEAHIPIRVSIRDQNGVTAELSFHGSVNQTFPLFSSLFKEEKSCSK